VFQIQKEDLLLEEQLQLLPNTIDYITIATTGDAKDFGDLLVARRHPGGLSDSHGGIS